MTVRHTETYTRLGANRRWWLRRAVWGGGALYCRRLANDGGPSLGSVTATAALGVGPGSAGTEAADR